MKSLCSAVLITFFSVAAFAAEPTKPSARIDLFNGRDFTGWKFVARSNSDPALTWTATNGVIHCTGKPAGYARTEQEFRDYRLTVEWRFVQIAPKADNSGIFVHVNAPDKVWPACVEIQGQHGRQGDLRMNGGATCKDHQTPETKNADASGAVDEKPPGEWNTLQAECAGDAIKLSVNGKSVNQITGCSVSSGAIGIQSEGGEIEVRRIFVEPLK